jgi:hypothetical protein
MKEYIYPTRANIGDEWARYMLEKWEESSLPLLCFPWILTSVHTLSREPFWMYLYYTLSASDIPALMGKIEYRVHVIAWQNTRYHGDNIYKARYDEDGKVWFLCDHFEEIRKWSGEMLGLEDFTHANGKNIVSTLRNSIPPVICHEKIKVVSRYP